MAPPASVGSQVCPHTVCHKMDTCGQNGHKMDIGVPVSGQAHPEEEEGPALLCVSCEQRARLSSIRPHIRYPTSKGSSTRVTLPQTIPFLPGVPEAPRYRLNYPPNHIVLPSVCPQLLPTYKEPQSLPKISFTTCHSSAQEPGMTPYYLLHPILIVCLVTFRQPCVQTFWNILTSSTGSNQVILT